MMSTGWLNVRNLAANAFLEPIKGTLEMARPRVPGCQQVAALAIQRFGPAVISPIQGVSEISTLILTGNRTHQKEQLFSLPFWRKTLRSGLKK
jgi:hypothetical protein